MGGPGTRLASVQSAAESAPGTIANDGGLSARTGMSDLWVAVPPDDSGVRAREVVTGLTHERALSDHIAEPARSTIRGLAILLATLLGEPMPRVPLDAWSRRMGELGPAFGISSLIPGFDGVGAIDPQVVLVLARSGGSFEVEGDRLWLRIPEERRDDAAVAVLLRSGEDRIPLG